MFHRITMTAAAALLAAGPALAGGFAAPVVVAAPPAPVVVPVAPVVVASNDWGGFYVGGNLAYGRLDTRRDEDDETPFFEGIDDEKGGPLLGAHIGYMFDFGRFVAGVEAAYLGANFTDDEEFAEDMNSEDVTVDNVSRLGVRLGYDAGRFLPYVTAGMSNVNLSKADGEEEFFDDEGNDRFDDSSDGNFFGAGVEYMIRDNISVGAEVMRYDIDVEDSNPILVDAEDRDTELTTFGVRASFRF